MEISATLVKELREKTGVGIMDCKTALQETDGDISQAVDYLRKKGIATAKKRGGRATTEGQVQSYIHAGGKIGVLVEVNCETDFTGKTEDFTDLVKETLLEMGYDVTVNDPYKGAELVRAYCDPSAGRHSLQIEINRSLYMDEESFARNDGFDALRANLTRLIDTVCTFAGQQIG